MIDKIKGVIKWYITLIVTVVFAVCAVSYHNNIQGLEQPGGLGEALIFFFKQPEAYSSCLWMGILVNICSIGMLVLAVISVFLMLTMFMDKEYDLVDAIVCVVNIVLAIVFMVVQSTFVPYFGSVFLLAVLFVCGVILWIKQK